MNYNKPPAPRSFPFAITRPIELAEPTYPFPIDDLKRQAACFAKKVAPTNYYQEVYDQPLKKNEQDAYEGKLSELLIQGLLEFSGETIIRGADLEIYETKDKNYDPDLYATLGSAPETLAIKSDRGTCSSRGDGAWIVNLPDPGHYGSKGDPIAMNPTKVWNYVLCLFGTYHKSQTPELLYIMRAGVLHRYNLLRPPRIPKHHGKKIGWEEKDFHKIPVGEIFRGPFKTFPKLERLNDFV